MFCKNCGAQNPDGTKFCSNCGAALEDAASAADATQVQPTVTAQPAPAPQGAPASQPVPAPQGPAPKPGNGKTVAIVVLAVLLAAAIGLVVYFVVLPQLNGGQQAATNQPAQEQEVDAEADGTDKTETDDTTMTPDTTAAPDTTTPSAGTTLEDMLRSSGQYDEMCDTVTESMEQDMGGVITDAQVEISDNTVCLAMELGVASTDPSATQIVQEVMNTYTSDDVATTMGQICAQMESELGLSDVTYLCDFYTSDGVNVGYVGYGASGVIAAESAV